MLRIVPKGRTARNVNRIRTICTRTRRAVRSTFRDVRSHINNRARQLMEQPKSGKHYRVYVSKRGRKLKRGRIHVASSKNEAFAWMSGATFRSLRQVVPRWNMMTVGFNTIQGAVHESTWRTVLKRVLYGRTLKQEFDNAFQHNLKRELYAK